MRELLITTLYTYGGGVLGILFCVIYECYADYKRNKQTQREIDQMRREEAIRQNRFMLIRLIK